MVNLKNKVRSSKFIVFLKKKLGIPNWVTIKRFSLLVVSGFSVPLLMELASYFHKWVPFYTYFRDISYEYLTHPKTVFISIPIFGLLWAYRTYDKKLDHQNALIQQNQFFKSIEIQDTKENLKIYDSELIYLLEKRIPDNWKDSLNTGLDIHKEYLENLKSLLINCIRLDTFMINFKEKLSICDGSLIDYIENDLYFPFYETLNDFCRLNEIYIEEAGLDILNRNYQRKYRWLKHRMDTQYLDRAACAFFCIPYLKEEKIIPF